MGKSNKIGVYLGQTHFENMFCNIPSFIWLHSIINYILLFLACFADQADFSKKIPWTQKLPDAAPGPAFTAAWRLLSRRKTFEVSTLAATPTFLTLTSEFKTKV
jgi:hypothetical protein